MEYISVNNTNTDLVLLQNEIQTGMDLVKQKPIPVSLNFFFEQISGQYYLEVIIKVNGGVFP